jgi:hypothetical protein
MFNDSVASSDPVIASNALIQCASLTHGPWVEPLKCRAAVRRVDSVDV